MSTSSTQPLPTTVRQSHLADRLPAAELQRLDELGTIVAVPRGHRIISEQTDTRQCYVIIDGDFTVSSPTVNTTIGAGDVAGELALLTGRPRTASVTADRDGAAYRLDQPEFEVLLDDAPRFRSLVAGCANDRLGPADLGLGAELDKRMRIPWSCRLARLPAWSPAI